MRNTRPIRFLAAAAAVLVLAASTPLAVSASEAAAACGTTDTGILWRHDWLAANRRALEAGDDFMLRHFEALIAAADAALSRGPYSVMDKTSVPPSGDRHDYVSLAPYWWPDPENPGGPYVRRDGETNPERATDRYDKMRLNAMCDDVQILALANYFGGNPAHARHAAALIDAWFLAPATRMNPSLEYAQGVPGRSDGRGSGIIDTRCFTGVIDAALLLEAAGAFDEAQLDGLRRWMGDYAAWLVSSANGRRERDADNNHGSWYDVQLGVFGLFSGSEALLHETVLRIRDQRLPGQVRDDGRMPEELERTRAMHYTLFNLLAFQQAATLARCGGQDLWSAESGGINRLRVAADYPAAHYVDGAAWPWRDIKPPGNEEGYRAFMTAWHAWGDPRHREAARHFENDGIVGLSGLLIARERLKERPAGRP